MSLTPRAHPADPDPENHGGGDQLESNLIGVKESSLNNEPISSNAGSKKKSGKTSHHHDSVLHAVINIASHVIYPVITAPFLCGLFYIFAALRLATPRYGWCSSMFSTSSKRRCSSTTLFVLTGGLFRACPSATRNGDYAVIVFIVGLALLFGMCAPMFNIVVSDPDVVPGDSSYVATTIVGYVLCVYLFLWIGLKFSVFSRAEKARERLMLKEAAASGPATSFLAGGSQVGNNTTTAAGTHGGASPTTAVAVLIASATASVHGGGGTGPYRPRSAAVKAQREAISHLEEIKELEVTFSPLWTIFVGILVAVIECVLFKTYSGHFTGAAARFRNLTNEWSALTYASAFFLLSATNIMCWFGLFLLYEQEHRLATFCEQSKLSASDTQVAKWAVSWQYLLQDMERTPLVCSIAPPCSILLFFEGAISLLFGVFYYLYNTAAPLQDLIPIAIFLGSHSLLLLILYLYVIVRTSNVIETQHKEVSAFQNAVQLQVDAASLEADDQVLPLLRAKVRVLQALDRYLVIADPKPKILGTSVDSFRWAIINVSLFTINLTFLLLYLVFCYKQTLAANINSKTTTVVPTTTSTTLMNSTTATDFTTTSTTTIFTTATSSTTTP
jgi:hypothetical protein